MDIKSIISELKDIIKPDSTFNTLIDNNKNIFIKNNEMVYNLLILKELFFIIKNNLEKSIEEIYSIYLISKLNFFNLTQNENKYDNNQNIYEILFSIFSKYEDLELYSNTDLYILKNDKLVNLNKQESTTSKSDITMFGEIGLIEDKNYFYIDGILSYGEYRIRISGNLKISSIKLESGYEFVANNINDNQLIELASKRRYFDDIKSHSILFLNNKAFEPLFLNQLKTSDIFKQSNLIPKPYINIKINDNTISDNLKSSQNCIHVNELEKISNENQYMEFIKKYSAEDEYIYCKLCGERLLVFSFINVDKSQNYNVQLRDFFKNSIYEKYIYSYYTVKNYIISFSYLYKNYINISDFSILITFLDVLIYISNNLNVLIKKYVDNNNGLYFIRLSEDLFTNTQRVKEQYEQSININMIILFFILYVDFFTDSMFINIKNLKFIKNKDDFIFNLLQNYLLKINNKYNIELNQLKNMVRVYQTIIKDSILHDIDIEKIQNKINKLNKIIIQEDTNVIYDNYENDNYCRVPYSYNNYTNRYYNISDKIFNNIIYKESILDVDIDVYDFEEKKQYIYKNQIIHSLQYENSDLSINSLQLTNDNYIMFNLSNGKEFIKHFKIFEKSINFYSNLYFDFINLNNKLFFINELGQLKNKINNIYIKFLYNTFKITYIFDEDNLNDLKNEFILVVYKILKSKNENILDWILYNKDNIENKNHNF